MAPKAKESSKDTKAPAAEPAKDGKEARPQRPNKEEFEKRINDVQEQIEKKRADIDKIIADIEGKSTGKEEYNQSRSDLFEQLKKVKDQRNSLIEARSELVKAGKAEREEAFQSKLKMKQMERDGKDMNEESIDSRIAEYEYMLNVRSKPLSLKEEKNILMEIKKLKASRPAAIKHTKELEALKAGAAATDGATAPSANREASIKELNDKLDSLKAEQEQISTKLDTLKESRDSKLSNLKPLIEKRQTLRDEVSALIESKKAIVDERKKAFDKYREFEQKLYEERKEREEQEWAKWRAEQAAEKAKQELEAPNPFLEEVTLLQQTIEYCKGLLPQQQSAKEEKADVEFNNPEGYAVMKSKKDRESEMYVTGLKGKKNKKNLPPKEDGPAAGSTSKKAIKHTAETFSIFKQLQVATPMTVSDLPALIEVCESKLKAVNDKVSKWETERKEKVEAARIAAEKGETAEEEATA